ncbi:MAG: ABC transporter substrate-binding protein [Burkholderiales bacterium]
MMQKLPSKLGLLLIAGLLAIPVTAQQKGAAVSWERDFKETLAAAEAGGKVTAIGRPGDDREAFFKKFQERYPNIKIEYTLMRPSNLAPRLLAEQQKGVYLWDVMVEGGNNVANVLKPAGASADIRDYLIRDPKIVGDANWRGGFEDGFRLSDNIGIYSFAVSTSVGPYVNRDQIAKQELSTLKDLADLKWKGKIVINDPRLPAHGQIMLASMLFAEGPEYIKKIMVDQNPVYVTDVRQMTQWLATGRYPIAIGADTQVLDNLKKKGVGKGVETLLTAGIPRTVSGVTVNVFKNPPHPAAAKIFVHWFLGQEGQKAFSEAVGETNSRRVDVKEAEPEAAPDWNRIHEYTFSLQRKAGLDALATIGRMAKEIKQAQ